MKFLDQAKIYVRSGNGGPGSLSFRREKYIEFGGPDGGNGGRGGDVIFEVVGNLNTLIDFRYQQHYKAKSGRGGAGRNRSGANGQSITIKVPPGTQILDETNTIVLADLTKIGQKITLMRGGDGGFGNAHYKSSTNRAPRKTTPGWPGEERALWLRLKLIADSGLVGLPNAGKSTFLAASSRAKPKIADYPFTTLHPNLGIVEGGTQRFVLADIPGLIEGAHDGHGLGTRFLGHVERTAVLLHLIDGASESAQDVVDHYQLIRGELEAYSPALIDKPEIIGLNKIDALSEEDRAERLAALQAVTDSPIFLLSAVSGEGVPEALEALGLIIAEHKEKLAEQEEDELSDKEIEADAKEKLAAIPASDSDAPADKADDFWDEDDDDDEPYGEYVR